MNDEFLYQLRAEPSRQFAHRLKARLDSQAREQAARQRRRRWYAFIAAILMGGAAAAFVTPSVREWTYALLATREAPRERSTASVASPEQTVPASVNDRRGAIQSPFVRSDVSPLTNAPAESPTRTEVRGTDAEARQTTGGIGAQPGASGALVQSARAQTLLIARDRLTESLVSSFTKNAARAYPQMQVSAVTFIDDRTACAEHRGARAPDMIVTTARIPTTQLQACVRIAGSYRELVIAHDAIALIVNRENFWTQSMTVAELKQMVEPRPYEPLQTWNQIRAEWPTVTFTLVGTPDGTMSTDALRKVSGEAEPAVALTSADDAGVIREVDRNMGAIGYISIRSVPSVLVSMRRVVGIVAESHEAVAPTIAAVRAGQYPLARPIYAYVNVESLRSAPTYRFLMQALDDETIDALGYVRLSNDDANAAKQLFANLRYQR